MHAQNKSYGKTDKWGVRHTCYIATATQNLKDFRNSSPWKSSHIMDIIIKKRKYNLVFLYDCLPDSVVLNYFSGSNAFKGF